MLPRLYRRYQAPVSSPTSSLCRTVRIPDDPDILAAFNEMVGFLGNPDVWNADQGGLTPTEAAAAAAEIMLWEDGCMIGTLVPYVGSIPPHVLRMDGQTYDRDDYPDLWLKLPDGWKNPTTFTLPDMSGHTLIGSHPAQYPIGSIGGEAEHTLTVAEMPRHRHTYDQYTFGIDVESVGVPDPTGVGQPLLSQDTGWRGNDQPHNNLPPYVAVRWGIYYR